MSCEVQDAKFREPAIGAHGLDFRFTRLLAEM